MIRIWICCIFFLIRHSDSAGDVDNLRFVHVVWRHGDRSPSDPTFPTDTGNNITTWPQGWGELSDLGMVQQYKLGAYLKRRYEGFLSPDYRSDEIYIRSSDYNRTIMSALANLAGMYPILNSSSSWMANMTWQPVPVHSRPRVDDPVLWMSRPCPAADKIYFDDVLKSEYVRKIEDENKEFLDYLRRATGFKLETPDVWWKVYDPLNCELRHNDTHKWPSWVNESVFQRIKALNDISTTFYYHDFRLQRFRGSLLLGELASRMYDKATNSSKILPHNLKYYVYSAHDNTIEALLEAFGLYNGSVPQYATALIFELRENPVGHFYVEVWHINETGSETPHLLNVQSCGQYCKLDQFVEMARIRTPTDWYRECGYQTNGDRVDRLLVVVGVMSGLAIAFFLLFLVILVQFWKLRQSNIVDALKDDGLGLMLTTTAIGLFLGVWSLVYLIDYYFRLRNFRTYVEFAERTGLVVSPFQVRLYAGHLERSLSNWQWLRWAKVKRFLDWWFLMGVAGAICALFFMMFLLTSTLHAQLWPHVSWLLTRAFANFGQTGSGGGLVSPTPPTSVSSIATAGVTPVIPGVNIPWSQLPLLFVVLVLAGVFHELGHAVAAVNENVTVNSFGVFVLGIYPGAFTELDSDRLESLHLLRRLKIYCGGIWHNLVMAFLALLVVSSLPYALLFGYMHGKGVVVTDVGPESGLAGDGGLRPGNVIYGINYCKVFTEDDWLPCLSSINRQNTGYCVPRVEVATNKAERVVNVNGELHCCNTNSSQSHLCFYGKSLNESTLEQVFDYSCLPARYVTDHSICNYSLPCGRTAKCVYAALFNSTKLMRFHIANQSKPVLFIGSPGAILTHLSVGSYVPRYWWTPSWLPVFIDLFCRYLFTFSLALGLLNAVPCYTLDGQYIVSQMTESQRRTRRKQLLYKAVMTYGTVTLLIVVFLGLASFLRPLV